MPILAKEITTIDSKYLAEYILLKAGSMSQLKLHKILYYIHSYHLAYFDSSLIDDTFQAWVHGPISMKIYNLFKEKYSLYSELSISTD